jgi:hypothetical protein
MPGKNPLARSDVDWQALRSLHEHGASFRGLSNHFGVARTTIVDHARRNGWKRVVEPSRVDKHKTKEQLLSETDHFLAIATKNLSEHLSKLTGKHIREYAAQLKILAEVRERVFKSDESQVGRKNGKPKQRTSSSSYFAADADELAQLTKAANGEQRPDTESGEPSRESLND